MRLRRRHTGTPTEKSRRCSSATARPRRSTRTSPVVAERRRSPRPPSCSPRQSCRRPREGRRRGRAPSLSRRHSAEHKPGAPCCLARETRSRRRSAVARSSTRACTKPRWCTRAPGGPSPRRRRRRRAGTAAQLGSRPFAHQAKPTTTSAAVPSVREAVPMVAAGPRIATPDRRRRISRWTVGAAGTSTALRHCWGCQCSRRANRAGPHSRGDQGAPELLGVYVGRSPSSVAARSTVRPRRAPS
jgi:hypothetical protein